MTTSPACSPCVKGANVPTIVGYNLGNVAKQVMRVFAVILLLLVGVVFVAAPAGLLAKLTPDCGLYQIQMELKLLNITCY